MKILKRTNGIDTRAKGSHLKGSAILTLRDGVTGKIVEEVKHDNFFTSALDSALNGCPWGLDKVNLWNVGNSNGAGSSDGDTRFGNLYESLLGGIMLFPNSLGNGTDDYYPDFDTNYPTAYASGNTYVVEDSKQGTFTKNLSGIVGNGYKYVYDWSTGNGNGFIESVCLSHKNCYKYFNDGATRYFPVYVNAGDSAYAGYFLQYFGQTYNSGRYPFTAFDDGILSHVPGKDNRWARFYAVKPYDFQLLALIGGTGIPEVIDADNNPPPYKIWEEDYTSEFSNGNATQYQFDNDTLYGYCKASAGSAALQIITIDPSDGSVLTRASITFATPQALSSQTRFAIKNGYIYMGCNVGGKIYKCNLSNVNEVTEITCNYTANTPLNATNGSENIYGSTFILNNDTPNPVSYTNTDNGTLQSKTYIYENGVWIVNASRLYGMSAQIKAPYCATKNNITRVEKRSNQTMQVQYTVTQV